MARIIELIESERNTGKGIEGDPCRIVNQLFTKDGKLIAEYDQWNGDSFVLWPNFYKQVSP